jgi:peptidoglycan/LPS O-acetylase OafA/YrhL
LAAAALPLADHRSEGKAATAASSERFHIPSLDGLRAASFIIVFTSHAGLEVIMPGAFGVTVFFFLSGYLITTLMRTEVDKTGRVSLGNFYLRRALRILPPFYIVLLAATALAAGGFLRGDLRPMAVASQILHFSNYWMAIHGGSGVAAGTGVYWSLAVEEHFYLLFPAVFLVLSRLRLTGRQKAFGFWGTCAIVLAWRCVLVYGLHADVERVSLCSDTRVDSIAFGCALAVWNNPMLDGHAGRSDSPFWSRLFFLVGVGLLLVTFLVRGPFFRETFRYTLQGIGLTPIFIMAMRHPRWYLFRLLNWRPMRFLGAISYSMYLVHQVVLGAVQRHSPLGAVPRGFAAFLISLAIAWTMHVVVERPCTALRKRLEPVGHGTGTT